MISQTPLSRHRLFRWLAVLVLAALPLTACAAKGGTSSSDDTLTIGVKVTESMNPALSNSAYSAAPMRLAYDALIVQASDGTFEPGLATSWGYTDDTNTSFDLQIREGVTFSDGDELTPQAVADSINYFVGANGPNANLYAGLTAVAGDGDTVHVTSVTPNPDLEVLFTDYFLGGCIISPTGLADTASLETTSHGVGEYVYSEIETGSQYTLVPNDTYYDQDAINFTEIVAKVFPSDSAATQALISGQISLWSGTTSASFRQTAESNDLNLIVGSPTWIGLQLFDAQGVASPALADVRVRQAIEYAIDRDSISEAAYGEDGVPRVQPANDNWVGFDESLEDTYSYDPDKAKELLAEAGYADGFSFAVTYLSGDAPVETLVQAVAANLASVGITLELVPASTAADVVGNLTGGTVSAIVVPDDMRSVNQMIARNNSTGGLNGLGQIDAELMSLTAAAAAGSDASLWTDVLSYMVDQALTFPVAQPADVYLATQSIDVTDAVNDATGRLVVAALKPAN